MKIIIVGGGIGGLATALSCASAGHEVAVLERQDKFTEIGAGIQLAPNAFHALDHLGVGKKVKSLAVPVNELRLMDGVGGGKITTLTLGDEYQEYFENPYMVVHRTDLYYPLLDECQSNSSIELRTSCNVARYEQDAKQASVVFEDGEVISGDIIIGADGIRSTIRQQLIGDGPPRVSGHSIYRAIIPMEEVPEDLRWNAVTLWAGKKWHFVHYPIASGKYMNLAATIDDQATIPLTGEPVSTEKVMTSFDGLADEAKRLLSLGYNWKEWVLCDRDPVANWIDGKVALLGDAAHPMLQYAAQGACTALEDAVVIGELLKDAKPDSVSDILQQYNELRADRTARVVEAARFMGTNIYHATGEAAEQRNAQLIGMTSKDMHSTLQWLHGMRPLFFGEEPRKGAQSNNTSSQVASQA